MMFIRTISHQHHRFLFSFFLFRVVHDGCPWLGIKSARLRKAHQKCLIYVRIRTFYAGNAWRQHFYSHFTACNDGCGQDVLFSPAFSPLQAKVSRTGIARTSSKHFIAGTEFSLQRQSKRTGTCIHPPPPEKRWDTIMTCGSCKTPEKYAEL